MAKLFAGLDVADASTSICVMEVSGAVIAELSAATTGAAITAALSPYRRSLALIGHESGCKATWLYRELKKKKLPVVCLDAWHTHSALRASRNKTDRNDARGIAEVLCRGIFTKAHVRSEQSQIGREMLTHRRALIRKSLDLQLLMNSTLKLAGAKCDGKKGEFVVRSLNRRPVDSALIATVLHTHSAIVALQQEALALTHVIQSRADGDAICRGLMTVPGVGPITAFAFRTAVDDPERFSSSRMVAAHFGLTPRTFQSGQTAVTMGISKRGDAMVRSLLYQSAGSLLNICKSECRLRQWGLRLRAQKGFKVAAIACARKMAVVMHKMWVTGHDFDSGI